MVKGVNSTYATNPKGVHFTPLFTPCQIKQAIKANHVYKGFRWAFLERHLPDTTVQDIGETVQSQTIKKGFVAMLDLKKSKIVSVFCDQKEAGQDRGFRGCAPISKAIQKGTQSGGHYFMMWHDCDEALQATSSTILSPPSAINSACFASTKSIPIHKRSLSITHVWRMSLKNGRCHAHPSRTPWKASIYSKASTGKRHPPSSLKNLTPI